MATETAGILIARERQRRGMTQRQLAKALQVASSTVANWERGASYPARKAGLIEEVLGIAIPERPRATA